MARSPPLMRGRLHAHPGVPRALAYLLHFEPLRHVSGVSRKRGHRTNVPRRRLRLHREGRRTASHVRLNVHDRESAVARARALPPRSQGARLKSTSNCRLAPSNEPLARLRDVPKTCLSNPMLFTFAAYVRRKVSGGIVERYQGDGLVFAQGSWTVEVASPGTPIGCRRCLGVPAPGPHLRARRRFRPERQNPSPSQHPLRRLRLCEHPPPRQRPSQVRPSHQPLRPLLRRHARQPFSPCLRRARPPSRPLAHPRAHP